MIHAITLFDERQRRRAMEAVRQAEIDWRVVVGPPLKSRPQERLYHDQIDDIAKQFEFCGRLWDAEDMKRLLLDQFRRDTIKDPQLADEWKKMGVVEMAPSLDRNGVVALGIQSRKFPKALGSAFIEWLYAFGAQNDVQFSVPQFNDR